MGRKYRQNKRKSEQEDYRWSSLLIPISIITSIASLSMLIKEQNEKTLIMFGSQLSSLITNIKTQKENNYINIFSLSMVASFFLIFLIGANGINFISLGPKNIQSKLMIQSLSLAISLIGLSIGIILICVGSGTISFAPGYRLKTHKRVGNPDVIEMSLGFLAVISSIGIIFNKIIKDIFFEYNEIYLCSLIVFITGISLLLGYFKPKGFTFYKNRDKVEKNRKEIGILGVFPLFISIFIIFVYG